MAVTRRLMIGAACALAMSLVTYAWAGGVKAGSRAPDFSLKDTGGKTVKLSGLRGKVVLVDFWATWCEPCKKELPELDKLAKAYKAAGGNVVIVAVNIDDDKDKALKFLKDKKIKNLVVVFDSAKSVAPTYDPPSMPTSYAVDHKGIIKHVNEAYQSGDEKKVKKQLDELAAAIPTN